MLTHKLLNLKGWHHHVTILLLGALTSLALPPANLSPIIFISFPALIFILDGRFNKATSKAAKFKAGFASGWWLAFGYFITSLYWIGASFLVEADKFAIFMPLAVLALPAGLAIFWGLGIGLSLMVWQQGPFRFVILASFLSGFEWLRGHVLTGFPWNTIGYISDGLVGTNQLASIIGIYGLTFFIVLWAVIPLCFLTKNKHLYFGGVVVLSLIGSMAWGIQRQTTPLVFAKKPTNIRIVQPNIAQENKWDPRYRQSNINLIFSLSKTINKQSGRSLKDVDILVWPESALPLIYQENIDAKNQVSAMLPQHTLLIMGGLRRDLNKRDSAGQSFAYNSVLMLNNNQQTLAFYDKSHLVPFGEYLPGETFLAPLGLRKIVDVPHGFSIGAGPQTFNIAEYPSFSSLVCYEIIFPGKIFDHSKRPKWIVNVTNDAWFGKTAGPHQHLAQTRFRAIETGLPIVRAANTGISALIGPYGRVIEKLKLEQRGILDVILPQPVASTWYSQFGDNVLFSILFCVLILLGLTKFIKSRTI